MFVDVMWSHQNLHKQFPCTKRAPISLVLPFSVEMYRMYTHVVHSNSHKSVKVTISEADSLRYEISVTGEMSWRNNGAWAAGLKCQELIY